MLLLRLPGVFLLRLDKASLPSLLLKEAPRTERGPDTPVWKVGRAPQCAHAPAAAESVYRAHRTDGTDGADIAAPSAALPGAQGAQGFPDRAEQIGRAHV